MNRMSASEYRKLVIEPALREEDGDREFVRKVAEITPSKKPMKHEEDDLTIAVANYLEALKIAGKVQLYSHIPASTYTRSWSAKSKNKEMGVRAGVPDVLVVYPHEVLFLELKREDGGKVSEFQKEWIFALNSTGKVHAKVASGWVQAKNVIDSFLR